MHFISKSLLCAATFCLAVPFTATANAQTINTPAIGGVGGAPFRLLCPAGQYMVGVRVRDGAWIDGIAPICAAWSTSRRAFVGAATQYSLVGGGGGSERFSRCAHDAAIAGMEGQQSTNEDGSLGWLRPNCRRAIWPRTDWEDPSGGQIELGQLSRRGGLKRAKDVVLCPTGMFAIGIYGRSGAFVDRLGFVCRPAPA